MAITTDAANEIVEVSQEDGTSVNTDSLPLVKSSGWQVALCHCSNG